MKEIFRTSVLLSIIFFVLASFIVSFGEVAASGQASIPPTHSGFIDKYGYYRVVGEVENIGDKNIRYLLVNATFYNAGGIVIATRSSYAMLDVLSIGRKAPFEIVLPNKTTSASVDRYNLSVSWEEYSVEKPSVLQILETSTYIDEAGFQKVNGTVKNLGTSNAIYVKVVATFYNAQGKVVGATYDYTTPSSVPPNQTEPFELELGQKAGNFSSYSLTAESKEYEAMGFILINDGAIYSTTTSVTLTLSATNTTSRVAKMRFSNDNINWAPWEAYSSSKSWNLSKGDGTKTVYVQFMYNTNSISPTYYDTIILDTTPPAISITSPVNASEISSLTITVTWIGSDTTSGISHFEIRLDDGSWINMKTNTSQTYTTVAEGSHTIEVKAIDKAGNSNQSSVNFIINAPPSGSGLMGVVAIVATIAIVILVGFYFLKRRKH